MDRFRCGILTGVLLILSLAGLALAAALVVPFDVNEPALIRDISGTVEHVDGSGRVTILQPSAELPRLRQGDTLRLEPDSQAAIVLELTQGRAGLSGPAQLMLVESSRRATALGHIFDSDQFDRDYTLTLEQTTGNVNYNFANTTPAFASVDIIVRLPDGNYRPTSPCWQIIIDAAGDVDAGTLPCPP